MSTPSSTWKVLHWTDAWPRPAAGDAHRPGTGFLGAAWMDSTWIPKAAATGQAVRNEADRASGRLSSLPKTVIASGQVCSGSVPARKMVEGLPTWRRRSRARWMGIGVGRSNLL